MKYLHKFNFIMEKIDTQLIRHFLATLSYRANKIISNIPENYPELIIGNGVRTPKEILHHILEVLLFAKFYLLNENRKDTPLLEWNEEVKRFNNILNELDKILEEKDVESSTLKKLLQGPLSDAMTHIGQLALLRRLAGSPISGENFMKADINTGKTNMIQ